MTTVRKTEPDDYSTFRGWLTTTENVISYTGTDFSWEDFDDSDNPEMSATVARHIRRVLLQSWARVEKPNLKTLVVLAPGCLSCLEYPADDHRVRVRLPVSKHRPLAFP